MRSGAAGSEPVMVPSEACLPVMTSVPPGARLPVQMTRPERGPW